MSHLTTPEGPAVEHPTPDQPAAARRHVLIADCDDHSCDRRRSQLRKSGFEVSVSRTGFETIVKACCHLPDLIVLDESLGDSELAETARLLATCPVTAHIPVIRVAVGHRLPRRVIARRNLSSTSC